MTLETNAGSSSSQKSINPVDPFLGGVPGYVRMPGREAFQAWLARLCGMLDGAVSALLVLEEASNTFVPVGVWPHRTRDVTCLSDAAQKCLIDRTAATLPAATDQTVLVTCPVEVDGYLHGAVVVEVKACPVVALQQISRQLSWGMGWLEAHIRRLKQVDHKKQIEQTAVALDIVALAGEHVRLQDAALSVANELCSRLVCTRIAIGIERKNRIHLIALSNSALFERKSQFVADIENAMDEALDQRKTIAYPALEGLHNGIAVAHRDLAKTGGVLSVVLRNGGRGVGVITFERVDAIFTLVDVELCQAAASLVGPIFEMKEEAHQWFAGRTAHYVRRALQNLSDPRRPSFRYALVSSLAFLMFVSLVDGEYRVPSKAVLEGEIQRAVVAPFDGYIAQAYVRAGQTVKKGQSLVKLDDRDLLLERQKWASEFEQYDRKYRDALAKHERSQARIMASQVAEAEAQLNLVKDKLVRTEMVAPFDGIVVTGDLSQMFGSPVEQGKLLFEIAPLNEYRVILKVDERDIRDVAAGKKGSIVLSGMAEEAMPLVVSNISIAEAEDGHNFFRVEAQLQHVSHRLRPGMEGVGKISVGDRKLIWIWTHHFVDWLRLLVWDWLP